MRIGWKRTLSALLVIAMMAALLVIPAAADAAHTLWIVGDSTVCDFGTQDADYYYPRFGYGTKIGDYLDGTYEIQNLALSGRSSKSFLTESQYQTLLSGMKAGDALIIGFAHNDEKQGKNEAYRYTDPTTGLEDTNSFAYSLWHNYVEPAGEAGVEVVLCTPIVRRTTGTFSNSELHITSTKTEDGVTYNGGDYPQAIRNLAQEKEIALVDLTVLTKALYEELTPAETLYLHAWTSDNSASVDATHINEYGAKRVAYLLADALKNNTTTELGKHVKDLSGITFNRATDLQSNPAYVHKDYTPPVDGSGSLGGPFEVVNQADTTGDKLTFYSTAFGSLGAKPTTTDFAFSQDDNGDLRIKTGGSRGKVASGEDGFAILYLRLPVGTQFAFSATATLNSLNTNSQAAFGIMARDDMYIDVNDKSIVGDYVAAGTLGNGSTNCFYRKSKVLGTTGKLSSALANGNSYNLSIVSNSDGYTCTFGKETPQSGGFDFALTAVDSENIYLCLFATRDMDVTFSNIALEIGDDMGGYVPPETGDGNTGSGGDNTTAYTAYKVTSTVAGGGPETLFADLKDVKKADVKAVSYTDGETTASLTGDDFTYLVRDVDGGARIDIPGVKAGAYTLTVTVGEDDYVAKDIVVKEHDRSGFAHYNYTQGVGAYNDDGTLKDNALVVYVTNENKNNVTATFTRNGTPTTVTGIGNILNSNSSKINLGLLEFLAKEDKRPLVVRFIGDVKRPEGVSEFKAGSSNGGMVYMLSGANVTLEGIGPDAAIDGWGFSFGADKDDTQYNKQARNFEVRNLTFINVPEDCVEVTGFGNSDGTIRESVEHIWIHNNAFYVPHIENPAEDDKGEGDGAVDFKWGNYMTMSYNYFEGYHKTSLVGGADSNIQYHVTWHHNHWKDVQSRSPLARSADMHIYNNYYEHQTSYCMSLRASTYIFSEFNTFLNSKDVAIDEGTGGVAKSYGDVFTNCTGKDAFVKVTDKTQPIEQPAANTNPYFNFDTDPDSYVAKGAYKLDSAEGALDNIKKYGGTMKTAAEMDTVNLTTGDPGTSDPGTSDPGTDDPDTDDPGTSDPGTSDPGNVDTSELAAAIEAAKKAVEAVKVSTDGSNANKNEKWVTQAAKDAYNEAIKVAEAVAGKEDVTEDEVKAAIEALATATKTFEAAQKDGIRSSGGISGGSGGSGSSGGGSTGGTTTKPGTTTGTSTGASTGTTTTTTTDKDGTTTTTTTTQDGKKTETVTKTDGTVTETVTETNGTKTETVKEPDGTTTETVTKTDGSKTEKVTEPNGTVTETKTKTDGSKTETVKAAGGDVTVTATASNGEVVAKVEIPAVMPSLSYSFMDVPAGHWAESAINTMAALSVVEGVSNDGQTATFDMNANITRGAMAQILFNLSQGKEGKVESFGDVAEGAWYTDAVAWASDAGVVTGYSENAFGPEDSITREQLAVMLYRYADLLGLDTAVGGTSLSDYSDAGAVSSWSADAMSWAVSNGLIRGKGENNLDPAASASRAETAVILQRFLDLVK